MSADIYTKKTPTARVVCAGLSVLLAGTIKAAQISEAPIYTGGEIVEMYGARWWYNAVSGEASMPFLVKVGQKWYRIPYVTYQIGSPNTESSSGDPITVGGETVYPYGESGLITDWPEGAIVPLAKSEDGNWLPSISPSSAAGLIEWENTFNLDNSFCGCSATDIDGDGLPDTYEEQQGFDKFDGSDGSEDNDSDGYSNSAEYEAGTDPFDEQDNPSNGGGGGGDGDNGGGGGSGGTGDGNVFVQEVQMSFNWLPESWRQAVTLGTEDYFGDIDEQEQVGNEIREQFGFDATNAADFVMALGRGDVSTNTTVLFNLMNASTNGYNHLLAYVENAGLTNWQGSFTGLTERTAHSNGLAKLRELMLGGLSSEPEPQDPVLIVSLDLPAGISGQHYDGDHLTFNANDYELTGTIKDVVGYFIWLSFVGASVVMVRRTVGISG